MLEAQADLQSSRGDKHRQSLGHGERYPVSESSTKIADDCANLALPMFAPACRRLTGS
jgi:hypothetical protein